MPRTIFFATRDDLLAILDPIERKLGLVYFPYGRFPESSVPQYASAAQIPDLGLSPTGHDGTDLRYLILPSTVPFVLRKNKYLPEVMFVDHDENPSAVVLLPGGCYGEDCIIQGMFLAWSTDDNAMELLNQYRRSLRRKFRRVIDCYVGPVAYEWLRRGARLTPSAQSSPELYLPIPEE